MKPVFQIVTLIGSLMASTFAIAECTTNRNVDMIITKPDSFYTDHGDGTVTDNTTGLMWYKCSLGLSGSDCATGTAQVFTWQAALHTANINTDNGYSDWRLPNKNELESLTDDACFDPAINETLFPATFDDHYWTSTTVTGDNVGALTVFFSNGTINGYAKNSPIYYVRLVRAGL